MSCLLSSLTPTPDGPEDRRSQQKQLNADAQDHMPQLALQTCYCRDLSANVLLGTPLLRIGTNAENIILPGTHEITTIAPTLK